MMSWERLVAAIEDLSAGLLQHRRDNARVLERIGAAQQPAAENLLDYIYLRRQNLEDVQQALAQYGLSSLGRLEHDVFGHLCQVHKVMIALDQGLKSSVLNPHAPLGRLELKDRCQEFFGHRQEDFPPFMVTLPKVAQSSVSACRELIRAGMSIARFNCSKMEASEALFAAAVVREAARAEKMPVQVSFELGGPKIRVLQISKKKKRVILNLGSGVGAKGGLEGALPQESFESWAQSRSHSRDSAARSHEDRTRDQKSNRQKEHLGHQGKPYKKHEREFKSVTSVKVSWENDFEILWPRSFGILEQGSRLIFDDGQLELVVVDVGFMSESERSTEKNSTLSQSPLLVSARVGVVYGSEHKLKVGQGCNAPGHRTPSTCLTDKDLHDLEELAGSADIVGFSFIRSAKDVAHIYDTLKNMNRLDLSVLFKIETSEAVNELPAVLLEILRFPRSGVMIARGDLALQIGFDRLIDIQQEILWFCSAARLPVVWATQVLDHLATTGLPTRAEVSDVVQASEADCIMLNRGVFLEGTLQFLRRAVISARGHKDKKFSKLRHLSLADAPLQ